MADVLDGDAVAKDYSVLEIGCLAWLLRIDADLGIRFYK